MKFAHMNILFLVLVIMACNCTQYASRCIDGVHGSPNLGEGLRFKGDPRDYHSVLIHKDDVDEFVKRYKAYRQKRGY